MKKILSIILVLVLVLAGCSSDSEDNVIVVGATSVPHAEILEAARPYFEEKGYELEIVEFTDYNLPNKALEEGDLDANYFQHLPYLNLQIEEFGYDFTAVEPIHIEPIGFYSQNYTSLDEVEDGATVALSNSFSDHPRALSLLQEAGLITIDPEVNIENAQIEDIVDNPKNLEFSYDYDASILPELYLNNEADLVLINTNFALTKGIDTDSALIKEPNDSIYANYLVVRSEDVDSEKTKVLQEVLTSDEVSNFITENYEGAVVPVN